MNETSCLTKKKQGSACVYSRKVESLYELVVLAINAITSSKQKKSKKKNGNDENVLIDDARTFLTLDWPEEGSNIDLEDEKNRTSGNGGTMNTPSALSTPRTAMRRRRAMLGLAPPPTMLMKSTPASLYGMLHANREKAFRLSTCMIDRNTGALLMSTNNPDVFSSTKGDMTKSVIGKSPHDLTNNIQNASGDVKDDDDAMDDVGFVGGDDYEDAPEDNEDDTIEDEMEEWWRPLDPHDSSGFRSRPIRKARTTNRLARKASMATSSSGRTDNNNKTNDSLTFTFGKQRWTWTSGTLTNVVKIFSKRNEDEFEDTRTLLKSMNRKWREEREEQLRRRQQKKRGDDYDDNFDDDDDDDDVFYDGGDVDHPDDDVSHQQDIVKKGWDELVANNNNIEVDAPRRLSSRSYENLVRAHIAEWFRGAEKYERTTQLSKRVTEWTQRLEPILAAEELHPAFDIHEVGDNIIERLVTKDEENDDEESKIVSFDSVVTGQVDFEICRSFLAMLQLANNGNLKIVNPSDGDIKSGPKVLQNGELGIELLSSKRSDIGDYRAPSVKSK